MLVKNKKYWFDLDAVRVPHKENSIKRWESEVKSGRVTEQEKSKYDKYEVRTKSQYGIGSVNSNGNTNLAKQLNPLGKNPADLWSIPTQPFSEAHFATFPEQLVEPMIKAGCPRWICKKCGKARVRIVETKYQEAGKGNANLRRKGGNKDELTARPYETRMLAERYTIGWTDCGCNAGWESGVVLDPFLGSGTTMAVARKLGRSCIGIELNPKYIEMAKKRVMWNTGLDIEFKFYTEDNLPKNL